MAYWRHTKVTSTGWRYAWRSWLYRNSYFNQLGMMEDDTLRETPEVKEAVRRLPRHLKEERQYRVTRALYLSMRKEILPKEEWTTYETDTRYLQPYLEEVKREFREREEWNKL